MNQVEHLEELQRVLYTMIQVAKYTVDVTDVLPDNTLQTIKGLREYCKAIRRNPEFIEKALRGVDYPKG